MFVAKFSLENNCPFDHRQLYGPNMDLKCYPPLPTFYAYVNTGGLGLPQCTQVRLPTDLWIPANTRYNGYTWKHALLSNPFIYWTTRPKLNQRWFSFGRVVQWINGFDKKQVVSGLGPERANTNPLLLETWTGARNALVRRGVRSPKYPWIFTGW